MANQDTPFAQAEILIRKPVAEVFEAMVNPAITSQFWFTKGSDSLEPGKTVRWNWEMYNASAEVHVKAVAEKTRLVFEWSTGSTSTTVEWRFTPRPDNTTFVSVTDTGLCGDEDGFLDMVIGSTEGFTLVLAGLKALPEHTIHLNLVTDRFPDGLG